ncbi:MAG: C45 family autoproteolytic acyltransferase/hydrolase [Stackebrandtia sp.]
MSKLPVVHLTGAPAERGRQHGAALADRIASNVELYSFRMRDDAGLSQSDIDERVNLYLDVFKRLDPDYVRTMEGIAEGSGQSFADIVMLNARFELLYSAWSADGVTDAPTECTAFGAPRSAAADGKQWIGQNWDWFPSVAGGLLAWRDGDLTTLAYTEAGIAGAKIGLNSAGVGLCVNGLGCDSDDWRIGGMPFHMRTGRILNSRGLTEAVAHASVDRPSCSANFLIGAARGGVVDVETSPAGSRRLSPQSGRIMTHANHFVDPSVLGVTQTHRAHPITTFRRAERLETLLNASDALTPQDVGDSLRDHDGGILGLCRHPDPDTPKARQIHTAFSVMLNLDNGEMTYTEGPPCESEYTTISLSDVAPALN